MEQFKNHFQSLTLYTCMIRKEATIKNKGMNMDDTPQHWSMKNLAVDKPKVPIQLWARSPSTQAESSVAVKRWETRLSKMKLLITNSIAPMQKRVISALDISSLASEDGILLKPLHRLRIFCKNDVVDFIWDLFCPFLTVFLSVLLFAISLVWDFFCKFSGKKRK
jgi:hypothetical protein